MMISSSTFIHVFHFLLKLYPKQFRIMYEEEIVTIFTAVVLERADKGWLFLAIFCCTEYFALLRSICDEYWGLLRKEFGMMNRLYGKFHNHLPVWGGIVFGAAYGLQRLFTVLTGMYADSFDQYDGFTILCSALIQLLFLGAATALFWLATPHSAKKWHFLPPVLGAVIISLLTTIFMVTIVYPRIDTYPNGWLWTVRWPELYLFLWGLIFGGLLGWVYQGWKAVIPFAIVSIVGKFTGGFVVGWVIETAFNINIDQAGNIWLHPEIFFGSLGYVIVGGMIFGAFLGWQADRLNHDWKGQNLVTT